MPSKRRSSSFFEAKRFESTAWSEASRFSAKTPPAAITGWVSEDLSAHTSTSGGSSDTSVNAVTVMPCTRSPTRAVAIATVAARRPSTLRRASELTGSAREVTDAALLLDLVDAVLRVELLVGEDHVDLAREATLRILLILDPVHEHRLALGDVGDLALLAVDRDRGAREHGAGRLDAEGRITALLHLEPGRRLRTLPFLGDLDRHHAGRGVVLHELALALLALRLVLVGAEGGARDGEVERRRDGSEDRMTGSIEHGPPSSSRRGGPGLRRSSKPLATPGPGAPGSDPEGPGVLHRLHALRRERHAPIHARAGASAGSRASTHTSARSIAFVHVGPVTKRPPAPAKKRWESLAARQARASSPTALPRASVAPSA